MEEEKKMIGQLPAEAFLVKDKSLKSMDAPFYKWLHDKGFKQAWYKGYYGCDWVFVNITHKMFAYGMPGIQIVHPTGNHAIRLYDFYAIYEIYEQYETMSLMDFE